LIGARFVVPARGPRNAWRFTFQDLIVLRTARALVAADVPQRRIMRSLRALRRELPASMPLSGLAISAVGDRVVVRDGDIHRQAESGQYLLAFDGNPAQGALNVIERGREKAGLAAADAQAWFARGAALERDDIDAALDAYRCSIVADATQVEAHVNYGRLLHDAGRYADAEHAYRDGITAAGEDPVLLYNLGVVLEDLERNAEAVDAYEAAVRRDPELADAHYNLALLYEHFARPRDAIRHMARYRALTGARRN
jgi:tetratricopeptide (TPR) repeat protein